MTARYTSHLPIYVLFIMLRTPALHLLAIATSALFAAACATAEPLPKTSERPDLALPLPPGAIDRTESGNPKSKKRLELDPEFVKMALDTPSPKPYVWKRLYEFFSWVEPEVEEQFWELFREHLSRGGQPNKVELDAFVERVKKNMVFVTGDSFWFGDWGAREGQPGPVTSDDNNKPPQYVTVSSFSIYRTRVTFADFDVFTRATKREFRFDGVGFAIPYRFPDYPVDVNWHEAKAYCSWLAEISGEPFDLPAETQWEYAARDGGQEVYFAGPYPFDDIALEKRFVSTEGMSTSSSAVLPVGAMGAGELGIADMAGTGYEWVNDWYTPDISGRTSMVDPAGPKSGTQRVSRGASGGLQTALTRWGTDPNKQTAHWFRCALNLDKPWQ